MAMTEKQITAISKIIGKTKKKDLTPSSLYITSLSIKKPAVSYWSLL
ncbi:MAG: hypothetical protein ACRCX2_17550 [Paraclostridium sp.]